MDEAYRRVPNRLLHDGRCADACTSGRTASCWQRQEKVGDVNLPTPCVYEGKLAETRTIKSKLVALNAGGWQSRTHVFPDEINSVER